MGTFIYANFYCDITSVALINPNLLRVQHFKSLLSKLLNNCHHYSS